MEFSPLGAAQSDTPKSISIYDEVAFPSYPHAASHPVRLATIAYLCGMDPPSVEQARVLELGCGAGGNLLPIAATFPASDCLGIDLSGQQIRQATAAAESCGLTNARFLAADISEPLTDLGKFDFIICHGVYSWTTDTVRQRILAICAGSLSDNGVAYVNFNTYPGWHMQRIIRDVLFDVAAAHEESAQRIAAARTMIALLPKLGPDPSTSLGSLLRAELAQLERHADPYLFHAYLNVPNTPLHVTQFLLATELAGLTYIGDADPAITWPAHIAPDAATAIAQQSLPQDQVESLWDYHFFRSSRASLLTKGTQRFANRIVGDRIATLYAAANLRVDESSSPPVFMTPSGVRLHPNHPQWNEALRMLATQWPRDVAVSDLCGQVPSFPANRPMSKDQFCEELWKLFSTHVIQLSKSPTPCAAADHPFPRLTSYARHQARLGQFVTSVRHQVSRWRPEEYQLLSQLDGTHTRTQLASQFSAVNDSFVARLAQQALLCT